MGKIKSGLELFGNAFRSSKLFAMVRSQGEHPIPDRIERLDNGWSDLFSAFFDRLGQSGQAGLSLRQRYQRLPMACPDHRLQFPITITAAGLYPSRPSINAGPVGDRPAGMIGPVTLAALPSATQRTRQ